MENSLERKDPTHLCMRVRTANAQSYSAARKFKKILSIFYFKLIYLVRVFTYKTYFVVGPWRILFLRKIR